MKPVSVRFKCFGPYVKEQFIDFTSLEPNGLFLICGETGSGKTTILDAMCYALYGASSGNLRGDFAAMRCKQADVHDDTFVEYIFDSGQKRYRFYRQMKLKKTRYDAAEDGMKLLKTDDFTMSFECQVMRDGEFVPMQDGKDKQSYMNKKAEELLGLSYEQFRQVIVLPQGQFEKLLVSDSSEKEKILVTLFHAQRFSKIAQRLYDEAYAVGKNLEFEYSSIKEKLREYSCESTEGLEEKILEEQKKAAESGEKLKAADDELEGLNKENEKMLLENKEFQTLDTLKKKFGELKKQEESSKKEADILALSDRADAVRDKYTAYLDAFREKSWHEDDVKTCSEKLKKAEEGRKSAQEEAKAHESRREEYNKNKADIVLYKSKQELYKSLNEKSAAASAAEQEEKTAAAAAEKARNSYNEANEAWLLSVETQRQLMDEFRTAQTAYLASIGSTLAEKLVEGSPCPVCGSTSHPHPAQAAENRVTEEELDKLGKKMSRANKDEESKRRKNSDEDRKNREAQEQLSLKSGKAAVKKAELEAALKDRIEGIDSEEQLDKKLSEKERQTADFEKADSEIQDKLNKSIIAVDGRKKELADAKERFDEAQQKYAAQEKLWTAGRTEAGFADDGEYSAACIKAEEKNKRREKLMRFRAELKAAEESYTEKKKELEGRQAPDMQKLTLQLDTAKRQREEQRKLHILQEQKLGQMQKDLKNLKLRRAKYETEKLENDEAIGFARRLRGDNGVSLQRYVLGVMLSSITGAANKLLKTVYGGRYQLYRSNEASGSTHKKGLELEVEDANGRRSVTTLSGGEKFLLALSLAIGLSTVVQAQGSGVRLEAMFIDEGFGSLDRSSIDDALEILQGIKSSSGLVGIISHVERLRELIPAKIMIEKTGEGSQCKICC